MANWPNFGHLVAFAAQEQLKDGAAQAVQDIEAAVPGAKVEMFPSSGVSHTTSSPFIRLGWIMPKGLVQGGTNGKRSSH